MSKEGQLVEIENQLIRAVMDCDIRASSTRYEAARLSMWLAWVRAVRVLEFSSGGYAYSRSRYASTHLEASAVKRALIHAAKDPECAIWVHLPSGTLTAWPAFESPRNWAWAMLEDWRDPNAVPPGWHDMPYDERLASVLELRKDLQQEWEAVLYEMRRDEQMRSEWADARVEKYLTQTAENPAS